VPTELFPSDIEKMLSKHRLRARNGAGRRKKLAPTEGQTNASDM
jgi:hypothetical protein